MKNLSTDVSRKNISPTAIAVRVALLRRGLSIKEVATKIGKSRKNLSNQISAGLPLQKTRFLIEDALEESIWLDEPTLITRRKLQDRFGRDIYLASHGDLKKLKKHYRLQVGSMASRTEIQAALVVLFRQEQQEKQP